jgi:hypothetical protein
MLESKAELRRIHLHLHHADGLQLVVGRQRVVRYPTPPGVGQISNAVRVCGPAPHPRKGFFPFPEFFEPYRCFDTK